MSWRRFFLLVFFSVKFPNNLYISSFFTFFYRMKKRGQVTVFLIVGILLLATFAAVFWAMSYFQKETLEAETELPLAAGLKPQVSGFVESCLEEIATPGIYLLGIQGGVIYPEDPKKVLITENAIINYGYLNGVDQLETEKMEEQLNLFVEENLPSCLDGFASFAERGISVVEKDELKVDSKITPANVLVNLKYELEAASGEDSIELSTFSQRIPLQVGLVVSEAEAIIGKHREEPSRLGLSPPSNKNYFTSVFPFDRGTFIYSISDENSVIDGAPFTFMFAIRDDEINSPPELEHVPNMVINQGSRFTYQLSARDPEDDILKFSSDSPLFTVSDDGWIEQEVTMAGTYQVNFAVEDVHGLKDEQEVRFVVNEEVNE